MGAAAEQPPGVFQSTRPARGATPNPRSQIDRHGVSIHAPRAGRDAVFPPERNRDDRFNPRAPRGARPMAEREAKRADAFQSTRPARGATKVNVLGVLQSMFQSTRPARGATQRPVGLAVEFKVSIHAPRAGRDPRVDGTADEQTSFNPRAPRGARHYHVTMFNDNAGFQSTRPARGATVRHDGVLQCGVVSIHAPRAGRDLVSVRSASRPPFQSTRPARGATSNIVEPVVGRQVSIHAPRAGRDHLFVSHSAV